MEFLLLLERLLLPLLLLPSSRTCSYSDFLTHTQTYSYSNILILRLTHTQTYTDTDLLIHNTPKGNRPGCFHGPVRGQFVGMSQAV
eukprot:8423993-Pyramimonas_sp.AAC.1